MQELVDTGIELTRNYVYKFCSPTRSAIQSGRNPVHVNAQNLGMSSWDPTNPFKGVSAIPVNVRAQQCLHKSLFVIRHPQRAHCR